MTSSHGVTVAEVHLEQSEDEGVTEEPTDGKPRPVSIAVHAESKEDGSGKEFHLQVDRESLATASDELVESTTVVQVNSQDSSQPIKVVQWIM